MIPEVETVISTPVPISRMHPTTAIIVAIPQRAVGSPALKATMSRPAQRGGLQIVSTATFVRATS
jgi:hypothetical protein